MTWMCAWCQQEGQQGIPKPSQNGPSDHVSHGICRDHALGLRRTYSPSLIGKPVASSVRSSYIPSHH